MLPQFAKQSYLNLETYRRDGRPVRTPVWFVESDGTVYVYTLRDAAKARRIRHQAHVRIVPCDMRGNVKGEWVNADARVLEEVQKPGSEADRANRLLDRKYWLKRFFNLTSRLRNTPRVIIAIRPSAP